MYVERFRIAESPKFLDNYCSYCVLKPIFFLNRAMHECGKVFDNILSLYESLHFKQKTI